MAVLISALNKRQIILNKVFKETQTEPGDFFLSLFIATSNSAEVV